MQRVELGLGVLEWHPLERQTDRYGTVFLTDGSLVPQQLHDIEGMLGTLIAEVVDPRPPVHPGDWFHGVFPEMPTLGEEIVLGTGVCFWLPTVDPGSSLRVGLLPVDGRETLWLDIKALYRTHAQQVRLWFQPHSATKKSVLIHKAKRSGLEPQPGGEIAIICVQVPQDGTGSGSA